MGQGLDSKLSLLGLFRSSKQPHRIDNVIPILQVRNLRLDERTLSSCFCQVHHQVAAEKGEGAQEMGMNARASL